MTRQGTRSRDVQLEPGTSVAAVVPFVLGWLGGGASRIARSVILRAHLNWGLA
jgi:hypothetical protein